MPCRKETHHTPSMHKHSTPASPASPQAQVPRPRSRHAPIQHGMASHPSKATLPIKTARLRSSTAIAERLVRAADPSLPQQPTVPGTTDATSIGTRSRPRRNPSRPSTLMHLAHATPRDLHREAQRRIT
ncbi:hypothetical protein PMIN02_004957 [Paraphaeosphaeria minitans]